MNVQMSYLTNRLTSVTETLVGITLLINTKYNREILERRIYKPYT